MQLIPDSLSVEDLVCAGINYMHNNKAQQAAWFLEEAIKRDSKSYDALCNLAAVYTLSLGRKDEALRILKEAIDIAPYNPLCWLNLSTLLKKNHLFLDERACIEVALSQDNGLYKSTLQHALALNYENLGDCEGSIREHKKNIELDLNNHHAIMATGIMQMKLERWEQGLANYEHRLIIHPIRWVTDVPRWELKERNRERPGLKVLVCVEQGAGDVFQFARYGCVLKETMQAVSVSLFCRPELVSIMSIWPGWDAVYSHDDPYLPDFDLQIAMMSIPALLHYTYGVDQYAKAISPRVNNDLSLEDPFIDAHIGLSWRGNSSHANDEFRSIPFNDFSVIIEEINNNFGFEGYSLQVGTTPAEDAVISPIDHKSGWVATVEQLARMNLVITCDTAVGHLAGSLGIPTWILLPANNDWRWGVDGEKTPWYDSVRLFRQKELGDWIPVVCEVAWKVEDIL